MPVLIFEGVQGVGKSALIDKLFEQGYIHTLPFSRVQAPNVEEYVKRNIVQTQHDGQKIIEYADLHPDYFFVVDRFTASEYVFGQICKRKQDYSWITSLETDMSKHDILLVYVCSNCDFICSNIWKRRAAYFADLTVQNIPEALRLYNEYLEKTPLEILTFHNSYLSTLTENAGDLWAAIKEWSKHKRKKAHGSHL